MLLKSNTMRLRVKETKDKNGKSDFLVQKKHWLWGWVRTDNWDYCVGAAEHGNLEDAVKYMNSLSKTTKIVCETKIKKCC